MLMAFTLLLTLRVVYRLKIIPVPARVAQGFQLVNLGFGRSIPYHAIYYLD